MAAGKGERLKPITNVLPKPLIKVNGRRMIETIIDGLEMNGITDIYIVVGYLKEKFEFLKEKYPHIQLIENPYYQKANNISSLYVVREHLENAIILDGDQIIHNPKVLQRQFHKSGYNSVYTKKTTNEWLQQVVNDRVVSCSRNGGSNGWQLYSISRWNEEDAQKLKKFVEAEFLKNPNSNLYWDDIALFVYPEEFDLGIYPMNAEDVLEIDNLEELAKEDTSYEFILRSEEDEKQR